jgi:hypothetical protein
LFSNALSRLFSQHLPLSASRRQTLAWLVILIMRQGTVCLWRLAAHAESDATLASVQRRFYRFFQHVHLDGALTARIVVALALAAKSGAAAEATAAIAIKAHGRKAASLFTLGLKTLCKAIASPSRFKAEGFLRQLLTRAAPQANPKPGQA